jgi:hypothetical protein
MKQNGRISENSNIEVFKNIHLKTILYYGTIE